MAVFLSQYDIVLFLVSEAFIVISIIITLGLYRSFVKPLDIMASGLESLKQKDFSIKFVKMGQYEIDQLIDVYNQMIDQLRVERIEVNEQYHFLEKLINALPSGVLILDSDDRIQSFNPSALNLFGMSQGDLLGKKLVEIPHPIVTQLEDISSPESVVVQGRGTKTYKCHKAHFIHKGFSHHFIIVEELTKEILKAEKKAYEKVIRMMAHEINNTVGAVNSVLDSVKKNKIKDDEEHSEVLQICIERNRKMAKFMANFADVVRLPELRKKRQDLHNLLREISLLFIDTFEQKRIKLIFDLEGDNLFIEYDEQQIEQVLINIVKNALESIEQDGYINILTYQAPPRLIIRDTGRGIDDSFKKKLFSPFFSSKKEGQGIGLTLTKEILYKHKFNFSLESTTEGCTDFTINF